MGAHSELGASRFTICLPSFSANARLDVNKKLGNKPTLVVLLLVHLSHFSYFAVYNYEVVLRGIEKLTVFPSAFSYHTSIIHH